MARALTTLLLLGLLAIPTASVAAGADQASLRAVPASIICPPVEYVEGVPVIPEGAPTECVYIQTVGGEDPCAPDATGAVPVMCQSGPAPVDPSIGGDACWMTSDGSTNCPRTGGEVPLDYGRHFALIAVSLSGVRYEIAAGKMFFDDDRSFLATVGCNQLDGSVTAFSDGTYAVADLVSTKMYCEGLSAAETALSEILLGGALTFSQSDTGLIAQNSVGTLELIESMYDAGLADGEGRAYIGDGLATSDAGAPLLAITLLAILAVAGAAGLGIGLSRRT